MNYWLIKSEPTAYSINDLSRDKTTEWSGIRNYQARNYMRDQMRVGDKVLFYHSSCEIPAVVGVAEVASKPYPDATAFDPTSHYYDPKSKQDNPTWILVDIKFVRKLKKQVTREQIKSDPTLTSMLVAQKGTRLSIQPVTKLEFERIITLSEQE